MAALLLSLTAPPAAVRADDTQNKDATVEANPKSEIPNPKSIKIPRPDPLGYWLSPKAFRAATAKVMPSIVTVETYGGVLIPGGPAPKPKPGAGRRPPRANRGVPGISRPGEGPTTGLVLSEDGYIITSTFNFLRKPAIITVVLPDGSQHVAELKGKDETRKLCLLKIDLPEGEKLTPAQHAEPNELKVGQWAISVGVGYGSDDPAISAGIISARNRVFGKAAQTDANISPANYGGPLVDIEGRVIGICVPLSPRAGGEAAGVEWYDSGIGFAVPLHGLDRLIEEMKAGKTIEPGRMGVQPKPQQPGQAFKGIAVARVLPNSAADKAGLKVNDVITHIDGEEIHDMLHLRTVLGRYIAGDTIKVKLMRGDEELEIEMTLDSGNAEGDEPEVPAAPEPGPEPGDEDKPKEDDEPQENNPEDSAPNDEGDDSESPAEP